MDKLTFLEERFIAEFKKSGNGTQSYKAVRPDVSLKTAGVNASKLLKKTRVQLALKEALDMENIEVNDSSRLTRPAILGELMDIAIKAKEVKQYGSAVNSIREYSKIAGYYAEEPEMGGYLTVIQSMINVNNMQVNLSIAQQPEKEDQ